MLHIFIDGDACPVKQDVYRFTGRFNLHALNKRDRSRFLQQLDEVIQSIRRQHGRPF